MQYSDWITVLHWVTLSYKHYIKCFFGGEDLTESKTFCKCKTFEGLCEFSLLYDFVYKEMSQIIEEMDPNDTVA